MKKAVLMGMLLGCRLLTTGQDELGVAVLVVKRWWWRGLILRCISGWIREYGGSGFSDGL